MEGCEKLERLQISLAAARVNAEMTQDEIARKLHVGKQTIVSWEKGETEPKVSQALLLSKIYGIPLDNIFLPANIALSDRRDGESGMD